MATSVCGTSSASDTWTIDEQHDRGHAQEMDEPRGLEAAEQRQQFGELDRLPDRQAGEHDQDADAEDADVEQLLHRVVLGRIVVREPQAHRVVDGGDQLAASGSAAASGGNAR